MVGVGHVLKQFRHFSDSNFNNTFSAIFDIKFVFVGFQIKFRVQNLTQYPFFLRLINVIEVYDMLI